MNCTEMSLGDMLAFQIQEHLRKDFATLTCMSLRLNVPLGPYLEGVTKSLLRYESF